jgi:probable rRNA maturation factor
MTRIEIVIQDRKWRATRGLPAKLKRAAKLALDKNLKLERSAALTILLSDDETLRTLNRRFRRKNKATNVLSFPSAPNGQAYLGDVALAYGLARAEARASGKRFSDHAVHLAVHGVLHLLGYDHETERQARVMEPLETALLAHLGIADPYALRVKTA